jgi:hypothetical protein
MQSNKKFMGFLFVTVLAAIAVASSSAAQESIKLPVPQTSGGMPLMEALAKRQSIRNYSGQALSRQLLSNLLWAAFGINRPSSGKRGPSMAAQKARPWQDQSVTFAQTVGLPKKLRERAMLMPIA